MEKTKETTTPTTPNEKLEERSTSFLRTMLRIRAFEERVHRMYLEQQLFGMSPHLCIGEEAMATGVCATLRRDDYIVGTHRSHGHVLAKGTEMHPMMAEICGKETGYCKGRGGTMHIADLEVGIVGANGIVGAGLPIATGVGLSIKYRDTDQVCVCFFGDAASNQGTFHESINFCCAFQLPVIFVCENNIYGLSTPYQEVSATPDVADRALGYKMPGVIVDGMDVEAVYEAAKDAVAYTRAGKGPYLIEGKTYRYFGHSASDQRPYRTREEEENWKSTKDPITTYKQKLIAEGIIQEVDYQRLEEAAQAEAEDAAAFAVASPDPSVDEVMNYVYFDE
ncbi:MAG: thiamine pyrophosphate-dependent dehydrogenase E1 component subunit alpha [Anaerolineales bacterium]|jgi:TPP-dependent pyruvate/acetoin dehydrogenase alpha subunit